MAGSDRMARGKRGAPNDVFYMLSDEFLVARAVLHRANSASFIEGLRHLGNRRFCVNRFCGNNTVVAMLQLPHCDYGIVATKAIHTKTAIAQVAQAFDETSAVCSVQNGAGNEELIAEHVKYVIRGTTFPAGHPIAPGHIGFDIKGDTWVGPFEPTNTPMSRVEELAGLLTRAGMNTIPLKDARGAQWTKLIFNASTNPVGALTLLHHGAATRFGPTGQLFNDLITEGEAVARKLGIELHGDPRQLVQKGANAPGKHRASMLPDVLAKRQTEVDLMNVVIEQGGDKVGVLIPLNKALWGLIKGLEHSWKDPD